MPILRGNPCTDEAIRPTAMELDIKRERVHVLADCSAKRERVHLFAQNACQVQLTKKELKLSAQNLAMAHSLAHCCALHDL